MRLWHVLLSSMAISALAGGKQVVLSGKGRDQVAFLAGARIRGDSTAELMVKPIRTAGSSSTREGSAIWAELPGFELTDETRRYWDPAPEKPDWRRTDLSLPEMR